MKNLANVLRSLDKETDDLERLPKEERCPIILLQPNIPKPLHGVNPRSILGSGWWDKERAEAAKRTRNHCAACGVHKYRAKFRQWLEGHEVYEVDYPKGRSTYIRTVALCHYCHMYIHNGRLQAKLDKGEINHNYYRAIIEHGDEILLEAGLTKPEPYEGPMAKWGSWRLIIDGKRYPPIYKTPAQWLMAFQETPSRKRGKK